MAHLVPVPALPPHRLGATGRLPALRADTALNPRPHVHHPHVHHPQEHLNGGPVRRPAKWNDAVLAWLAGHVLASRVMFDAALVLPLLALPASTSVKVTLGVVSGSWIQWWALPALQRSQVQADQKRDAKADTDHLALTHIAVTADAILAILKGKGDGG